MQIGFDGTPLVGQRTGIGNYTASLLAALLHNYPADNYYLYSNCPLNKLEPSLQRAIQVPGYYQQSRWLWMQLVLPRLIESTQPDICHYTNASAPLWQKRPFVLTIHDASLFLHHQYHPWSRLIAIRALLPTLARRAAAIVTVSKHARHDLARTLRLSPDKIHVIYEAPAPDFEPISDKQCLSILRQRYSLPDRYILYIGTLEPRKNLRRLIQAVSRLHHYGCRVPLVLAGPKGWRMDDLSREIDELSAESIVHYLGYVPAADLPGLYSLATIFAFPSLYEGFGLPPLEAMACGTAVLTSQDSAMAEIGGEAVYLVNPYDIDQLTNGLHHLLTDRLLREELSQRGRQHVQQFSWERAAEATTAVYHQVLPGAN